MPRTSRGQTGVFALKELDMKRFVALFVFGTATALFLGGCETSKETEPYGVTGETEERQTISKETMDHQQRAKGIGHPPR